MIVGGRQLDSGRTDLRDSESTLDGSAPIEGEPWLLCSCKKSSCLVKYENSARLTLEFDERCVPIIEEAIDRIILSWELDLLNAPFVGQDGRELEFKSCSLGG